MTSVVRANTPFQFVTQTNTRGVQSFLFASQGGVSSIEKREYKYSYFAANPVPTQFLQSQCEAPFYINGEGLGLISRAWLQVTIQVSGAPVTTLPPFMWLDSINSSKDGSQAFWKQSYCMVQQPDLLQQHVPVTVCNDCQNHGGQPD